MVGSISGQIKQKTIKFVFAELTVNNKHSYTHYLIHAIGDYLRAYFAAIL
jgi:hypothetical protein